MADLYLILALLGEIGKRSEAEEMRMLHSSLTTLLKGEEDPNAKCSACA